MVRISNILKIARLEILKNRSKVEKRVILVIIFLSILVYLSAAVFVKAGITTSDKYYTFAMINDTSANEAEYSAFYAYSELEGREKIIADLVLSTGKFIYSERYRDLAIEQTPNHLYVFKLTNDRASAALSVFQVAVKQFNTYIYTQYDPRLAYPLRIQVTSLEREEKTLENQIEAMVQVDEVTKDELLTDRELHTNTELNDGSLEYTDEQKRILAEFDETDVNFVDLTDGDSKGVSITLEESTDQVLSPEKVLSDSLNDESVDNSKSELNSDELLDYVHTADINPYSQFKVLLIVIFMTMPLSMITLIYANSIMSEKINKRGIFLLIAPLKISEILIGKTLPYFLGALAALLPIVIKNVSSVKDGIYSSLVMIAIIIAYLAIGFVVAMMARSHKELSFLGIFFISLYSCYLLIPAFMLNFSIIALASPLTIVAKYFQQEIVSLKLLLFTIGPTLFAGICLYIFGSKLFTDLNMFSYRSISEKILDAVQRLLHKRWNLLFISMSAVPFVFLIEIMMIVFLLSLQSWLSIYILMFFAALTEEVLRNLGIFAIISQKIEKVSVPKLLFYSFVTGLGFFLGEKVLLLIMIAPFVEAYMTLILAGVVMPLLLHTMLTFLFALFVKYVGRGKGFFSAVMMTGFLHFLINLGISIISRGGL